MRLFLTVCVFIALVGCNVTNPHKITGPEISTIKPSEFDSTSAISKWVRTNKNLIELNFIVCEGCIGHKVKVHINLDDHGNVILLKVMRSSGKKELADEALIAIDKTQPFDISNLNKQDREIVKNIIFTFAPED